MGQRKTATSPSHRLRATGFHSKLGRYRCTVMGHKNGFDRLIRNCLVMCLAQINELQFSTRIVNLTCALAIKRSSAGWCLDTY